MHSLSDWLRYLESIHPSTIDMGLERVSEVAHRLSLDLSDSLVITIGGTNGKGTTSCFLESLLRQQGKNVAAYRSPHIIDYRERITLNSDMVEEQVLIDAFNCIESARGEISLTYFEFGTLAALLIFKHWHPDIVLLEVGLGGRLDATNIIDSDCAVVTSIGIDHQEYLGNTRRQIATEKAGIFRTNKPVVIGDYDPPETLEQAILKSSCPSVFAGRDFNFEINNDNSWNWRCGGKCLDRLPIPKIPLENVSTALATLTMLGISTRLEHVVSSCELSALPGRRQYIQSSPKVMLDVGHNPHAAAALAGHLNKNVLREHQTLRIVVGMLKDKALAETLNQFQDLSPQWYLASLNGPRGASAQELASCLKNSETRQYESIGLAHEDALKDSSKDDFVLIFGSFLTAAEVLA